MTRNLTALLVVFVALAGFALSFAVVPLVGWSSAIAYPVGWSDWFRSFASVHLWVFLWDFAVVGSLGAGIAIFLAVIGILFVARTKHVATVPIFLVVFFVCIHVLQPIFQGQAHLVMPIVFGRNWSGYGIELSIVFWAAVAALTHKALSHRRNGL